MNAQTLYAVLTSLASAEERRSVDTPVEVEAPSAPSTEPAEKEWVKIASDLVRPRVAHFCKKVCFDNRRQYRCTVDPAWSRAPRDAALCDWGNATYLWMLEELCSEKRIERVRSGAVSSVEGYWHTLVNSLPFWERFKDWRFRRRIRVPAYIKALDADAHRIFWLLCDNDSVPNMAQRLSRSEVDVARVVREIKRALQARGRIDLLQPVETVSLSGWIGDEGEESELPLPAVEMAPEDRELQGKVRDAYESLSWQEQFVIDAMVTDGLGARAVLQALIDQNISLDGVTLPQTLNVQHIYYFLRKTLARVAKLAALSEGMES